MIAVTDGQSRKVIVVVEDDSLLRESLSLMLQDFGYSVVDAEDADEAISVAVKSVDRVDLVFADVDIPGDIPGRSTATILLPGLPAMYPTSRSS